MLGAMTAIQFHETHAGARIAYRYTYGDGPVLVFLPGYMSDMEGGKASAVFAQAQEDGRACLLLDYSGCGQSSGDFAEGTLSRWRDEVLSLIDAVTQGPVILIGSSMGGWLMLLIGEALGDRLAGMVGIAAAPDFTDWGRNDADKAKLAAGETVYDENPYGPEPTPMHSGFWQDGEANKRLRAEIGLDVPVRLLHGQQDPDVPWQISMQLAERFRSSDIQVHLVKDGDHRLSRDKDIHLLLQTVFTLAGSLNPTQ